MYFLISLLFLTTTTLLIGSPTELRLVTSERSPYVSSEDEKGILLEITKAAFREAGFTLQVDYLPWARAIAYANQNDYHAILPLTGKNHLSAGFVTSLPILKNDLGILSRKKSVVQAGISRPTPIQYSALRGDEPTLSPLKLKNLTLCTSNRQQVELLGLGRTDAAIIDKHIASDIIISELPHLIDKFKFTDLNLEDPHYYVGFSISIPEHQKLREEFNKGLVSIRASGEYHRIITKNGFHRHKNFAGKKNIVIGAVKTDEILAMEALSHYYAKLNPDIEIIWQIMDETTLRNRMWGAISLSQVPYDIITIGSFESMIWPEKGWISPIDIPKHELKDFIEPVINLMKYKGKYYGVPFYSESAMTFYRKDLFQKAGITMPRQPSYDQILAYAEAIHNPKNGIYGIGVRGKPGWGQSIAFISILINTFGGRWFDQQWNSEIDSKEWRKALVFYKKMMKFGPPQPWEKGWSENQQLFSQGKIGILIDATSLAGRLYDPKKSVVPDKISFTKAPRKAHLGGEKWLWSWAFAIPSNTPNKEEANSFIRWATSKQYVRLAAKEFGWVTVPSGVRYSTYSDDYRESAPFADFVLKEILSTKTSNFAASPIPYRGPQFVSIKEFPAIGKNVARNITLYVQGKITLSQAITSSSKFADYHVRLHRTHRTEINDDGKATLKKP